MKIKRFFASDMRQAIKQVREALGADAVILSNKTVDGGVELVAAIDYDESAVLAAASKQQETKRQERELGRPAVATSPPKARQTAANKPKPAAEPVIKTMPQVSPAESAPPEVPRVEWSQDPILKEMRREMQALRRMMENELSELTWRDMEKRHPNSQELLRRLIGLGLSPDISHKLLPQVQDIDDLDQAWRRLVHCLAGTLPVTGDRLLQQGGVVAVIGPTGVGKTTSVAKLAARFCLKHGNRHVALITTDSYRIGARDQLNTYARILDVPVRSAGTAEELGVALNAFCDKRLILIDTAGMSQRDVRLSEQLSLLTSGGVQVRSLLALPATMQQAAMEQAIKAFSAATPDALILTKLDEAASLGGAFSAAIHSGLPLAYTTDGQRVPEDLHLAHANALVGRAAKLIDQCDEIQDDDYMALAVGGVRSTHTHV